MLVTGEIKVQAKLATVPVVNLCFCQFTAWWTLVCGLVCVQVIMIECADLKNVINYQEVEALKHTIKVERREGDLQDHMAAEGG